MLSATLCSVAPAMPPDTGSTKSSSDGAQPVQHPLQQGQVGTIASVGRPVDDDELLVGHVTDQDADDAQRKMEVGGDQPGQAGVTGPPGETPP